MTLPTIDDVMAACEADDHLGFCIKCGEEAYGVETDARKYKCESCGEHSVFGAEECLISGFYSDSDQNAVEEIEEGWYEAGDGTVIHSP
jgi:predicted RNA-binding Zn-ribbon protein involved in translation (DUF1610 family)